MPKIKIKAQTIKETPEPKKGAIFAAKTAKVPVKRIYEIADSLDKRAEFERQTADMIGSSMESVKKSGGKSDYMGRDDKKNTDAVLRHLDKADSNEANAARYRKLAAQAEAKAKKK